MIPLVPSPGLWPPQYLSPKALILLTGEPDLLTMIAHTDLCNHTVLMLY